MIDLLECGVNRRAVVLARLAINLHKVRFKKWKKRAGFTSHSPLPHVNRCRSNIDNPLSNSYMLVFQDLILDGRQIMVRYFGDRLSFKVAGKILQKPSTENPSAAVINQKTLIILKPDVWWKILPCKALGSPSATRYCITERSMLDTAAARGKNYE